MTGQEAIPVDEAQPSSGPCAWCQTPTTLKLQTQKPKYRTHGKVKVLAKAPIEAWCCPDHQRSLALTDSERAESGPVLR